MVETTIALPALGAASPSTAKAAGPALLLTAAETKLFDSTGLSLARLYDSLITRDARIARAAKQICFFVDGYEFNAEHILDRKLTERSTAWPALLSQVDLLAEWCDPNRLYPSENFFLRLGSFAWMRDHYWSEYALAQKLHVSVRERLDFMMRALSTGAIEAWGHTAGYGPAERISTGLWDSLGTRISFNDNEVHALTPGSRSPPADAIRRQRRPVEETLCLWRGVVVRKSPLAQAAPEAPIVAVEAAKPKNKGGAPPKYDWDRMYELLTIHYGQFGPAESGEELIMRVVDLFAYMGMHRNEISKDTVRLEIKKRWSDLYAAAVGTAKLKPLPKPREPVQKVR